MQMAMNNRMLNNANMERMGSGMDGSDRPHTPGGSSDHAPSPSKRQRLDGPGSQFSGGQMRGPGMQAGQGGPMMSMNMNGQAGMMPPTMVGESFLVQSGVPTANVPPAALNALGVSNAHARQKAVEMYKNNMAAVHRSGMQGGGGGGGQQQPGAAIPGQPGQGSPMLGLNVNANGVGADGMLAGGGGGPPGGHDYYANPQVMRGAGAGQPGPNGHALQDYQMQLMLLEQQNRKRLLMAKAEQEGPGGPSNNGGNGGGGPAFQPGISPGGSRTGPSPNPSDMMKRGGNGSPQMAGSPMPDGSMGGPQQQQQQQQRSSPNAGMGGFAPGMEGGLAVGPGPNGNGMLPNGMRPPLSLAQHQQQQMAFSGDLAAQQQHQQQQQMAAMRAAQQQASANAAAIAQRNGGGGGPAQWPQGQPPPVPQQQQQQQQQLGTPRQPNAAMPPPPAGAGPGAGPVARQASPAPSAAGSTPQAAHKPNPKKKGDAKRRVRVVSVLVSTLVPVLVSILY